MFSNKPGTRNCGDHHANPGWLAASGIACRLGRHWPAAAIVPTPPHQRGSWCADCGTPMERTADGHWHATRRPVWIGAGTAGALRAP